MARVRALNPGFFLDDELAELPPLARILFAGLWCIADREGRLKDRPKRIKAETLPYDDVDVDELLDKLAAAGFIYRYKLSTDGHELSTGELSTGCESYIAIPTWSRYQNPHHKEPPSRIKPSMSQAWLKLESSMGQAWSKLARSSSSSSSSSRDASLNHKSKCPECETDLVFEDGIARCPVCEWRKT